MQPKSILIRLGLLAALLAAPVITARAADELPPVDDPAVLKTLFLPFVMKSFSSGGGGVANGGFESGSTSWTVFATHSGTIIRNSGFPGSVVPHSGTYAAWLGGAYNATTYLQQTVTVPGAAPHLAYWHWIASNDVCGYDLVTIRVNGATVETYDLCDSADTNGWVKHVVNLAAYAGQSVALQIRVTTDESLNSNLFVDDVAFQASPVLAVEEESAVEVHADPASADEMAPAGTD